MGRSQFPSFIYARGDDFKEWPLVMRRIDVPAALPLAEDLRDVAVENIELVGTTGLARMGRSCAVFLLERVMQHLRRTSACCVVTGGKCVWRVVLPLLNDFRSWCLT